MKLLGAKLRGMVNKNLDLGHGDRDCVELQAALGKVLDAADAIHEKKQFSEQKAELSIRKAAALEALAESTKEISQTLRRFHADYRSA